MHRLAIATGGYMTMLCSDNPRALDFENESLTVRESDVTCRKCLAIIHRSDAEKEGWKP